MLRERAAHDHSTHIDVIEMSQDTNHRAMRILAVALALVPIGFGALRALQTGTDFRYLVTAIATLAVAAMIFRFGAPRVSSRGLLAGLALLAAALTGSAVAFWQGARSAPAVLIVAFAFSLCTTASGALGLFARGPRAPTMS